MTDDPNERCECGWYDDGSVATCEFCFAREYEARRKNAKAERLLCDLVPRDWKPTTQLDLIPSGATVIVVPGKP